MFMEQKGYILFVKTQNVLQCSQIQKHLIGLLIAIIKQIGTSRNQTNRNIERIKMRYKGYTIKLNLQNKTVRFYNDIDDCNIYIGLFINKTLKQIELIILDMIDKRIKYLTY
jgi:hypothetical protein